MALYGAPEGITQGIHDINYMAKAPLELAVLHQSVDQGKIQTQTMQMDLDSRKKMIDAMSHLGEGSGKIENPADLSDALAAMWMQAGNPDKAMKAYGDAAIMRNHAANTAAAQGRKVIEDLQANEKMTNYEIGQLGTVTNQAELDALNSRLEKQFGHPVPWKGMPYSPQLKDKMAKTLLSVKDQLRLDLDTQKAGWQKQYQNALLGMKEAQLRLSRLREDRLARSQKAKEGKVSEPTQAQVNSASNTIRMAHPSFVHAPIEMQDNLSLKVAEDARRLMAKNSGLRFTDAVQQSLANPETRQDLKAIADAEYTGSILHTIMGSTPPENEEPSRMQGVTSVNPLPYSSNPDDYNEGNWYSDPQGVPRFYKNGMFYTVEELK